MSEGLLMRRDIKFNQQRNLCRNDIAKVAGNAIDTLEYGVVRGFMHDRYFFLV